MLINVYTTTKGQRTSSFQPASMKNPGYTKHALSVEGDKKFLDVDLAEEHNGIWAIGSAFSATNVPPSQPLCLDATSHDLMESEHFMRHFSRVYEKSVANETYFTTDMLSLPGLD